MDSRFQVLDLGSLAAVVQIATDYLVLEMAANLYGFYGNLVS